MKNIISVFFIIIIFSCTFIPKSQKITKTGRSGEIIKSIKYDSKNNEYDSENFTENRLKKLRKGVVYVNFLIGSVIYARSGDPRSIRDDENNIIEELDGKLKYSYVFSPIKTTDNLVPRVLFTNISVASIIVFKTTKLGEKEYEVKKLKLISAGSNIDFERYRKVLFTDSIPKTQVLLEEEKDFITSYNFGTTNTELLEAFALQFDKINKEWRYMLANLTLYNKLTKQTETYRISLDPELFNDTIRLIKKEYRDALIEIPVFNAP